MRTNLGQLLAVSRQETEAPSPARQRSLTPTKTNHVKLGADSSPVELSDEMLETLIEAS